MVRKKRSSVLHVFVFLRIHRIIFCAKLKKNGFVVFCVCQVGDFSMLTRCLLFYQLYCNFHSNCCVKFCIITFLIFQFFVTAFLSSTVSNLKLCIHLLMFSTNNDVTVPFRRVTLKTKLPP